MENTGGVSALRARLLQPPDSDISPRGETVVAS
jgi:hypothetical protein